MMWIQNVQQVQLRLIVQKMIKAYIVLWTLQKEMFLSDMTDKKSQFHPMSSSQSKHKKYKDLKYTNRHGFSMNDDDTLDRISGVS